MNKGELWENTLMKSSCQIKLNYSNWLSEVCLVNKVKLREKPMGGGGLWTICHKFGENSLSRESFHQKPSSSTNYFAKYPYKFEFQFHLISPNNKTRDIQCWSKKPMLLMLLSRQLGFTNISIIFATHLRRLLLSTMIMFRLYTYPPIRFITSAPSILR